MTDNELYERAVEAAYDAGRNRDGTPPDEWTLGKAIDVVDAYLAIAPQGPVSAVVNPLKWVAEPPYSVARGKGWHYAVERYEGGVDLMGTFISTRMGFADVSEAKAAAQADYEQRILSALASPPPPAQADDGKDAEIARLRKLVIDIKLRSWNFGPDSDHEKLKVAEALIRELVAALDRIAKGAMYIEDFTASTSAVIWAKFALAKAKAAGFEP